MRVGLTQMDIVWEDKTKNKQTIEALLKEAKEAKVELLVFPEMTLTGFTMNTKFVGEDFENSDTVQFFEKLSIESNIAIAFGYVEHRNNKYYNTLIIVSGGRIIFHYDKIHPFNFGEEGKYYSPGTKVLKTEINDFCISGFICYDLRFPEVFQAVSKDAKLILVIANWPKERVAHWETLLRARAIENQSYIVGVNRIGNGNGLTYIESSVAYSPLGIRLTKDDDVSQLIVVDLLEEEVDQVRKQFPFKEDRKNSLYPLLY